MPHTTEHHVEEVEHALHGHDHGDHGEKGTVHAPDSFNARVAMTMAIIAAVLACVTMLSHRAHNETLRLHAEAGRFKTEAAAARVEASNGWAWYQAKRVRQAQYQGFRELASVLAAGTGSDEQRRKIIDAWSAEIARQGHEMKPISEDAKAAEERSKQFEAKAAEMLLLAEHAHHRGDRFDLAELAVEMGLILCSIAVLTKKAPFWLAGIVFGVLGIGTAGSAFLMH